MRLQRRDLEGLLDFVKDAHDVEASEPLTTDLLDQLTSLVGCEFATFVAFDWRQQAVAAYVPCSNEGADALPGPMPEGLWTGEPSDPRWAGKTGALHKVSDRLDRRERERIRDEEEHNAAFRIVDGIGFRVGDRRRRRSGWVGFDSQVRDFGERERLLALALRPHVEALWRRAEARRRATEVLGALDGEDDAAGGRAVIVHRADGRIDHATPEAKRLLTRWFGPRNSRLPHGLEEWFTLARPGDRYTERRNGSILEIESVGDYTIRLGEQASAVARLTPREREVLRLVAEGLTNPEIGRRLWVAPSTVAKHLEQAYSKLGVHTRTAAVAAATTHRPTD